MKKISCSSIQIRFRGLKGGKQGVHLTIQLDAMRFITSGRLSSYDATTFAVRYERSEVAE